MTDEPAGEETRLDVTKVRSHDAVSYIPSREACSSLSLARAQEWSLDGINEDWLAGITSIRGQRVTYANREVRAARAPAVDLRAGS